MPGEGSLFNLWEPNVFLVWAPKEREPWHAIPCHLVSTLKTRDLTTARLLLFLSSVPGGKIPRVETNERECWEFLDWRLASENDSLVPGQPSFLKELLF